MVLLFFFKYICAGCAVVAFVLAINQTFYAANNLKKGVPTWKAWIRTVNWDPELYTKQGNIHREKRQRMERTGGILLVITAALHFFSS